MSTSSVNDELGIDPIQIGRDADVVEEATGIGVDVIVDHRNGVGIGRNAQALGNDATAIGTETRAPSNWNTVIGYDAGSAKNGENIVAVGRKAETRGNNAVAIGETARANGEDTVVVGRDGAALSSDATAIGRNSLANAAGAIAIGQGTTNKIPDSVSIGQRDYSVADGHGLVYPTGSGAQTLVSKPVDGSVPAGQPVGYDLEVGGTTVATVFAESDGSGGVKNARLDVPVSLAVDGDTTQVDDVVTGDIVIEDGSQTTQFRFDASVSPAVADFGGNNVTGFGVGDTDPITFGVDDDYAIRFDPSTGQNGALEMVDSNNSDVEMKFIIGGGVEYANQTVETKLAEGEDFFKLVDAGTGDTVQYFYDGTGAFNFTVEDSSAATERSIFSVDPSQAAQLDLQATLNFPGLTGTPTFGSHDHSEGGLTDVPNAGLVNDSVTVSSGVGLSSGGSVSLGGSVTVDHANTTSEGDLSAGAGGAIDSVSIDQFGHVTSLGTTNFDSRYDNYQSFTFEEGDGESTAVQSGERAIVSGGSQITTELVSAFPAEISVSHANTTTEGDLSVGAGRAIDSVSIDGNGHVTGLGSQDFDNRYLLESGDTLRGALDLDGNTLTTQPQTDGGVTTILRGESNTNFGSDFMDMKLYDNHPSFNSSEAFVLAVEVENDNAGSGSGPDAFAVDATSGFYVMDGAQVPRHHLTENGDIRSEGELTENAAL